MRTFTLLACVSLIACRNNAPEPTPQNTAAPPGIPHSAPQPHATGATPALPPGHPPAGHPSMPGATDFAPPPAQNGRELQWSDPVGWRRTRPTSSMRKAQYSVPGANGAEDAEVTVFYFGQGQGGAVQDNINRWHGQFEAEGADAGVFNEERTVNGLRVHITGKRGRFAGGGMMPGAAPAEPRGGWALLGAIVETPDGPWFFKMVGPGATVDAARRGFDDLVGSFRFP